MLKSYSPFTVDTRKVQQSWQTNG